MSLKANVLLVTATSIAGFTACNYTVGECYPRGQGNGDVGGVGAGGGSVIIPGGVGGFGDAPPRRPLDGTIPAPECNSVPQSPCNEKCLTDYETTAAGCGKIDDPVKRSTCQDGAYASYKSCRGDCLKQSDEKCKKACDRAYDKCMDKCKDGKCRDACWKDYVACLRECDR